MFACNQAVGALARAAAAAARAPLGGAAAAQSASSLFACAGGGGPTAATTASFAAGSRFSAAAASLCGISAPMRHTHSDAASTSTSSSSIHEDNNAASSSSSTFGPTAGIPNHVPGSSHVSAAAAAWHARRRGSGGGAGGGGAGSGGDGDGSGRPYSSKASERTRWEWMQQQGHRINPCNSLLHPAAEAGITPEGEELCVQDAYTPHSTCWGCGPSAEGGLRLRSFRVRNGLEARISLGEEYCAFPGIINGGIISTLMDCHGNWTAAVGLMDRSCLPAPPLTLTASILVSFKEPAPPNTELIVRSSIVDVKEGSAPGVGKASVEVDVSVLLPPGPGGGPEKVLATATGIFKKLGALRAL